MGNLTRGDFTLPGESGYEDLTLNLAIKWGADVIRDSDGTALSDRILKSGYGIYSTICIIRGHNEWAKHNPDKLQQSFLMSQPRIAHSHTLTIHLLDGYFQDQFQLNDTQPSIKYWQVFDRTQNTELPRSSWQYDPSTGSVTINNCIPWHRYTVNFLAYRIWEEISMYNHVTNNWDKEHLVPIEPCYKEAQTYLLQWMRTWCETHPETTVVRFTSLFYNFVWIWGDTERRRNLFTDWGSYDFTVSVPMLDGFAEKYGYTLTSEDFINQGKLHASHRVPDQKKRDWMNFVGEFVKDFGKQLIDIVHEYGKQAYVFYDDSWVGMEPYHERFKEYGFDGIIKCVFSGFEVRLCAGVDVPTHEIRLHPYLFPVGLGGAPTFMPGGHPTDDARAYWMNVRRALLRQCVDRIGLGGYLSLTLPFPDFNDYIEQISDEFRAIKAIHKAEAPHVLKPRVAVLTAWGSLRSWTLSGHFHETYMHELIHVIESLSGLPLDVKFIDFDDIEAGALDTVDVVINAGAMGSAWSGGTSWQSDSVIEKLTRWVHEGGAFIGIGEPSALEGYDTVFRLAHILGVDMDTGDRVCHGRWTFEAENVLELLPQGATFPGKANIFLTDGNARVLLQDDGAVAIAANTFGKGNGVYIASYRHSAANARALLNLILLANGQETKPEYLANDVCVDCAYHPQSKTLVLANTSKEARTVSVMASGNELNLSLNPFELKVLTDVG